MAYMYFNPRQLREYRELSEQYEEKFGGMFPPYVIGDAEEVLKELKRCLKTGQPSKVKAKPGVAY